MWAFILALVLSLGYLLLSLVCVERFHRARQRQITGHGYQPAVTIFKPVCGLGHEIKKNLTSFCNQDYPEYQVIFGLHGDDDPVLTVIREIMAENPGRDIHVVISPERHGSNHKVSNLINMYPHAKHGIVLIADDDMRVPPEYLARVIAPLTDPSIGAVTCLYAGVPGAGTASALNAMSINEWFLPSVLVSQCLGNAQFCFGATMALRRTVLEELGGFQALVDYLADDFMLGKFVAERGHRIHLSHFVVENIVWETGMRSLIRHELRWARTIRTIEPLGYAFTFLTDALMMSILTGTGLLLYTHRPWLSVLLIAVTGLARILYHLRLKQILRCPQAGSAWLIPVRDLLSFGIRLASFASNKVTWKSHNLTVDNSGLLRT